MRAECRITPACAGKTYEGRDRGQDLGDHPRVCGENYCEIAVMSKSLGSPPRVRGKPGAVVSINPFTRITPACAGKTALRSHRRFLLGDHPRVCGENRGAAALSIRARGSPPRVRGKRKRYAHRILSSRITPACAGKTYADELTILIREDHPRVCGENAHRSRAESWCAGSPPRVRGKPRRPARAGRSRGITPACAGKTDEKKSIGSACEDHPRVCGENTGTRHGTA